jgi:hypothetical protein
MPIMAQRVLWRFCRWGALALRGRGVSVNKKTTQGCVFALYFQQQFDSLVRA